ncbi:MAG: 5'/3'-nucleotidase SurE [candidate division WOR-3 bacterium]|jgi:5'-nucleotidase
MALILVSNDDGIEAQGLRVLKEAVLDLGRVIVFAPEENRSGSSHSLSIHKSIKVKKLDENTYSTDGTPTDCILYSVRGILNNKPNIVLGGINQGANLGSDVSYSGTVAVAMEGTLLGIPSIAFSQVDFYDSFDPKFARAMVNRIASQVLKDDLPEGIFLNVNLPKQPNGKIKITCLGNRIYRDEIVKVKKEKESFIYSLNGESPTWISSPNSDFDAVHEGFVSITPIHMEYTDFEMIQKLRFWEDFY